MQTIDSLIESFKSTGEIHHIWCKNKTPHMLRIIVFCAVKIANREKETEIRKGDRIDDQTRKFNLSEAVSL